MLHLFFDPLCGWCYGAAPALAALKQNSNIAWQLHPTGLFAHPQAMDAEMAQYFWSNDQRIAQMTGQVFSQAYKDNVLGDLSKPFNSSDATLAYYLISQAVPEQAIHILHRVQQLRYADGLQESSAFIQIAIEFGLDGKQFAQDFAAGWPKELSEMTSKAQKTMQQQGLRGVPALLLQKDNQLSVVPSSLLYQDPQALIDFVAKHQ
ncbi:DsbA family protein [Iodobacter sp. CM08]|uniref:DsbA family protein n=1 Tax=Iodobacter sp. CM08 TaxID=3085902 RepID=UPI002980A70A|nr:DsbA family protein [Iodobacter sp. CM08]MDW5415848.1 DsbA family protein [Iodobacter sp. CM08]